MTFGSFPWKIFGESGKTRDDYISLKRKLYLTVCYYHVTYAFQSKSTLYSCLNVKELLARNRRDIWILSDSNGIQTHNQLVRKRTFNHLAELAKWPNWPKWPDCPEWLSVYLRTMWLWVRIPLLSLKIIFFLTNVN